MALGVLLALLLVLYVASSFGLVSSNDGSHFAVTRALAERGTFSVDRELAFALNDTSLHDGRRYSSKPPGTAILALPLYGLSKPLSAALRVEPDPREDAWYAVLSRLALKLQYPISYASLEAAYLDTRPAQDAVTLLAAFAGVLALWATYRAARQLGASACASGATLLALGTGTLLWRDSTAVFAHVLGAALLAVQLQWLLSGRALRSRGGGYAWGLLLGASVAVEYQAALALPPLLLGWLAGLRRAGAGREALSRLGFVAAGLVIPIAGLAWYQYECFGSALATSASATEHLQFWYTRSIETMFSGSLLTGAGTMLFSSDAHGLFRVSPVMVLALAGWLCWPRAERRLLGVALGIVVLHCAVMFKVVAPEGGGTLDHRYLVRILPVLILPLGLALDPLAGLREEPPTRRCVGPGGRGAGAAVLFSASVLRSYEAVADFLKHRVLLPEPGAVAEGPLAALAAKGPAAFPSGDHGSLLALALALYALVAGLAGWAGWSRGRGGAGQGGASAGSSNVTGIGR